MSFRGRRDRSERWRRHNHREATPGARPAGHFNSSSVLFHNLLDDGEPDSGARLAGFLRFFCSVELLEDLLNLLLIHPDALIFHGNANQGVVSLGGSSHLRALRRVLHRISK